MANPLQERLASTAFAFRGYNVTNLGRSRELLAQQQYGPIVERYLTEVSQICHDVTGRQVDLPARVRRNEETTLDSYAEAISLIVAMSLAQIELLEKFFDAPYRQSRMAYGYSLGELTAITAGGVFALREVLKLPLTMADDCVALAEDVTMGVLFSRGPLLDLETVARLCLTINAEGEGVIGVSSHLAPNTVLLLGQGTTIDRFNQRMHDLFPARVYLRKNKDRWPPMHTPLVWERNINTRCGIMMHTLPGGMQKPEPPVFSLVTGKMDYNHANSRWIIYRWIDQPQRLWDAVYETLAAGIKTVIHVGPDPNLIPATYQRLSDNVSAQLTGYSPSSLGLRAMSAAAARPWLTAILPSRMALLRAPLVEHIILEDWLIENQP
jgi:[acyl-carrier-protein] S-malonyltransferase